MSMESVFDPLMPLYALVHYYGMMLMSSEQYDCVSNGGMNCGHLMGNNHPSTQPSQNRGTFFEFFGNTWFEGSFFMDGITDFDKILTNVILTLVTLTLIAGLVSVVVLVTRK